MKPSANIYAHAASWYRQWRRSRRRMPTSKPHIRPKTKREAH